MVKVSNRAILARIDQRIEALGLTREKAALDAGLGKDSIRDLARRPKTMPRLDTLVALAHVLQVTPEWLAFEVGESRSAGLRVRGEVAAGIWVETEGLTDTPPIAPVPVEADPDYPHDAQYGLLVRGTSVNRVARGGSILICVDVAAGGIEPAAGDLVIVERRRMQGKQREVTAKRVQRRGSRIELVPDSDDPAWKAQAALDPMRAPEGETLSICAVVIAVYSDLKPSPRNAIAIAGHHGSRSAVTDGSIG